MTGKYEAISGFFIQDDPNADPQAIGALPASFGLLDTSPNRWLTFRSKISALNKTASPGTSYKVFFLGRHGEGVHNAAGKKYGTKMWDGYWSKLNGDGELTWGPDSSLTDIGIHQAKMASALWKKELQCDIPPPEKLYCSPLSRTLHTNVITFEKKTERLVLENLREIYGEHTCDKRRSLSSILEKFPQFTFECGFAEEDTLWTAEREDFTHVMERAHNILDRIFANDKETYISITTHGVFIRALWAVLGREMYYLVTGGVLPVVIKGTVPKEETV